MENQNNQMDHLDILKQQMAALDNKRKDDRPVRKSKEEILAKYFVPREQNETFRILPAKSGKSFLSTAFFHTVSVNAGLGKKKNGTIYCPAHNDPKIKVTDDKGNIKYIPAPCPLCEKAKNIASKKDNSIQYIKKVNMTEEQLTILASNTEIFKATLKWEAKKYYILRGIDKGVEKDGVKFWRFKENRMGSGVYSKLMPILKLYVDNFDKDFTSEMDGTDIIIMTQKKEDPRTKRLYTDIAAISTKGASPLHADPLVRHQWLNDEITWRDVYKPKSAPNITPFEFLEMLTTGTDPYWDDSDQNNKHWVFPNRPDLEEKANTRNQNLDSESEKNFEQASDLAYSSVDITNVTKSDVGTYTDNAVDVVKSVMKENADNVVTSSTSEDKKEVVSDASQKTENNIVDKDFNPSTTGDDYEDLPF